MKKYFISLLAICWLFIRAGGQNITQAEYFIDTDPGINKATTITITPGANLVNVNFNANIAAATVGFHRIYLRTKAANGKWSLTNSSLFYKTGSSGGGTVPNLVAAEYFIDTDPGFGAATPVSITAGTNVAAGAFNASITAAAVGFHRIYLRTKDANGKWSLTNSSLFYKTGSTGGTTLPNLVAAEYFIDTDPGFGLAKPITITPGTDVANAAFDADIANTPTGFHRIYLRTKNANGKWSLANTLLIYKKSNAPDTLQLITAAEYFIDTDPGFAKAVPIALQEVKDLGNKQLYMNVTGLAAGEHHFYLRTKDMSGTWSLTNTEVFTLNAAVAAPALIVNSITRSSFCARDSFTIGYQVTGTYNAGNTFKAFLSNAAGSFASETEIGTISATKSGLITCRLPAHAADGTGYKLRIKSSNTVVTGTASSFTITIHDRPSAQTITGRSFVNGTYTWPYSLPTVTSTYNWIVNGGTKASGANTNAITVTWPLPLEDSSKGFIRSIETSQYGCVGDTSILSPIVIYKLDIADTVAASVCKGNTLVIKTGITGAFDAGNNLIAELSNASGSFASPTATVSKAYTANGVNKPNSFDMPIPAGLPNGTGYKVRVRSSSPVFTGDTSGAISILKPDIGIDRNGVYCAGYGYNLNQFYTDINLVYTYYTNAYVPISRPDSVQAGTYRIIGTNNIGCPDTATIVVSSNPSPSLGADTTLYHECPGETSNLLPLYNTSGLTAVWNTGTPSSTAPGNYRLVVSNNFGCADTAFAKVLLETATWTGTVSNNWHTPGNWNTNKVPTEKTHVIISTATPNICVLKDANGVAASLQVKPGATMQVINSRTVEIKGKCITLPSN